jgi:pyruvate formate lyase activating enzyme
MNRRQFFRRTAGTCLLFNPAGVRSLSNIFALDNKPNLSRTEARFYKKLPDREIECRLCPRLCRLGDKERGYCGVRENDGGTYITLVYGKACSMNVDPIEKKPFFHVLPGSNALSIATAGCNVNCKFCQNWEISQVRAEQVDAFDLPPSAVVNNALKYQCPVIAYTYSEPVVFYEYMVDTAEEARRRGVRNVVVSGGHINAEPLQELVGTVDAIKIDLKGFSQDFYTQYVRGELKPVLEAIRIIHASKAWLEIVYLVIPSLNDGEATIRAMSRWIKTEVGPDVPLHFSRFFPMYLLKNLPETPLSTLERAYETARSEGLRYVYIGNVPGHKAESTPCPRCGKTVVKRMGYLIESMDVQDGCCRFCRTPIPGIWA